MKKHYNDIPQDPSMVSEPVASYTEHPMQSTVKESPANEQIMASTVSVDDYFDELISKVRQDYEKL